MADITEIKRMLNDRVESVASHLLPNGRREGGEWRVGSVGGEPGKSLGVHLTGEKVGVWRDFATDEGGDLLDLWVAVKRIRLVDALREAAAWLGIKTPELHRPAAKSYTRPTRPQCRAPAARVRDYLGEDRNIPSEILTAYKIGERDDQIVFPFLLPDGTLALVKERRAADGEKPKPTSRDCEPVLFGWQAVPDDARSVVITEGEIDALSMAAYGYVAMSVPFGGGGGRKQQWIEAEYERMARFEAIYLATDTDDEGEAAADEIADRLGRHRCLRIHLPRKDANECLVEGVVAEEIAACFEKAQHLDPEGLKRPSEYSESVIGLFWPKPGERQGYETPYGKLEGKLLFRPAELTIWTGATGSGKSQIISDCVVDWVRQGSRVCLSSLEMKPSMTFKRMTKQVVGTDRPTEDAIVAALTWLDTGLLVYELVGKRKLDDLLEVFRFARAKYGCDQFVLDSLMRLGIAGDDYNTQEAAIFRIVDWAIENNIHVHLVAHSRKGERDRGVPGSEDVKGAMEIGANAFNIIAVWRNRSLEENIRKAESDDEREGLRQKPGVVVNVAKQRNGDFEGRVGLWFDQDTYRYSSSADNAAWKRRYLPDNWNTASREAPDEEQSILAAG